MTALWHIPPDAQRSQGKLVPHVSVGPLRFEMSPGEAAAAIGGRPTSATSSRHGQALVAQVPSELESWIGQRAERLPIHKEMFYMPGGECGSFSLGLVVCVQRAGDRLVTRPVFLPADANDDMYHRLPSDAWRI